MPYKAKNLYMKNSKIPGQKQSINTQNNSSMRTSNPSQKSEYVVYLFSLIREWDVNSNMTRAPKYIPEIHPIYLIYKRDPFPTQKQIPLKSTQPHQRNNH